RYLKKERPRPFASRSGRQHVAARTTQRHRIGQSKRRRDINEDVTCPSPRRVTCPARHRPL
ncbi:unnamed protein product, partial [Musa textilis]